MSRPKGVVVPPTPRETLKTKKETLVRVFNGNRQTLMVLANKMRELEKQQAEIQGKLQLIDELETA